MAFLQGLTARLILQGYVMVKDVLPPALIDECRRAYGPLKQLARAEYGWQAQRYQPLSRAPGFDSELLTRVRSYTTNAMLEKVFPPGYTFCNPDTCGVLINPGPVDADSEQKPCDYAMPLHRDWFNQKPHADVLHLTQNWLNPLCWYQFNLALYEDHSLFVQSGSHQYVDLVIEASRSQRPRYIQASNVSDPGFVDDYWKDRSRSGYSEQVELAAGDMVVYHSGIVHGSGNWVDRPRLTLHDFCNTPEFEKFRSHQMEAWAAGRESTAQAPWWTVDATRLRELSVVRRVVMDSGYGAVFVPPTSQP